MSLPETRPIPNWRFTILSIGFDTTLTRPRQRALARKGYTIIEANDFANVLSHLALEQFDLLLIGKTVPQLDREWLIRTVRQQHSILPILIVAPRRRGNTRATEPGCFWVTDPCEHLGKFEDWLGFPGAE